MVATTCSDHITLWNTDHQQIQAHFDGPVVVCDTGLLAVRALDRSLGFMRDLAERLEDPRSPLCIRHAKETILTQLLYQFLAGYVDNNDADTLREDPLMQVLADRDPNSEQADLASRSTLNRFQYAFTRREQIRPEDSDPTAQQQHAQCQRIQEMNQFLMDWFVKTQTPEVIILDFDATDDPVHGKQVLSGYHGYYKQHQYFPLFVYEGCTGFPLAAWLRPGIVGAACGAIQILQQIVGCLRQKWPEIPIRLRADSAFARPEIYAFCEKNNIQYAIGYASNPRLQRLTQCAADDVELYYAFYGRRDPHVQRFESIGQYQADSWDRPRRVIAKIERTPQGKQRRFVVTNFDEHAEWIYRDFYVQRGAVPEQCFDEMKNGLGADRLSSHGFRANSFRLLLHTVGYALVVLFRQACQTLPEVNRLQINSLRQRIWKVPSVVVVKRRRVCFSFSAEWQDRELFCQILNCVAEYAAGFQEVDEGGGSPDPDLLL